MASVHPFNCKSPSRAVKLSDNPALLLALHLFFYQQVDQTHRGGLRLCHVGIRRAEELHNNSELAH